MIQNIGVVPAKTLSAQIDVDGVFCVFISGDNQILETRRYTFDQYRDLDKSSYDISSFTTTKKYLFSQNPQTQDTTDFTTAVNKLTGQEVYVKYINPHINISAERHLVTLLDDHYFLEKKNVVHLHFESRYLHFYIRQNGLFIFYNSYEIENETDILYYTSLVFDNLNDDVSKDAHWALSGYIDEGSVFHQKILAHFNDFEFAKIPITFADHLKNQSAHYYFIHFLNGRCAS
jgi:hypothetical protein